MTDNPDTTPASFSVADEISKLLALKDAGHLTDEEFQQQKSRLLGGMPPPPPEGPPSAPMDAPSPNFARTVLKKDKTTGSKTWVAIPAIAGVVLLLLILGKACTPPSSPVASQDMEPLPDVPAWQPPEGFTKSVTDNGAEFGMRWLKTSEYRCDYGDLCWGMEIVTAEPCPNMLYAQITLLNKSDVDVGWTNDTAQAVPADQKVRLIFHTYERTARSARLGKVSCQ